MSKEPIGTHPALCVLAPELHEQEVDGPGVDHGHVRPRLRLNLQWGCISCRWCYLSQIIACYISTKLRNFFVPHLSSGIINNPSKKSVSKLKKLDAA